MTTQIRIIDNKKLALTQSEWDMYQSICRSYDRSNFKGEELFKDLFESDNNGIIIFLKPPASRYTSVEIFLFISALMTHQNIRQIHQTASALFKQLNDKIKQCDDKLQEISNHQEQKLKEQI